MFRKTLPLLLLIIALILTACGRPAATPADGTHKLKVVATTSIIGDVVANIGADNIDLTMLMPAGTDPHSFEPSPRQVAALSDADIVFVNGFDLEETLMPVLESATTPEKIVVVSTGVEPILFTGHEHADHGDADHEDHHYDPHVWMDPNNVIIWTQNIEAALSEVDPDHEGTYHRNAKTYRDQLQTLDEWIQVEISPLLPLKVVTDHKVFGYFARSYGIEQVGAIIPSYSSMAQPSAQEIAQLEDAIKQQGVKAILVGNTVNPSLAQRVAEDTGVQLIHIYTGSLSGPDGPAATYLDFMRYDVNAIIKAAQK